MNRAGPILLLVLLLAGCGEPAGRDASIGAMSEPPAGFHQATPGTTVKLPQDLGPHRRYRLEWWYLTANLHGENEESDAADESNERFGVQWTLFRMGVKPGPFEENEPGWRREEIWLAHAALSRPGEHRFESRSARGGTGQAGAKAEPFTAWIDHWQLDSAGPDRWNLAVDSDDFAYRLQLQPQLPAVLHGDRGFSAKSAGGGGSMYFSYPLRVSDGEVTLDGKKFRVKGQGWFDREWSSQYLQPDQQGWDWLALHLQDGRHLMLFRIRGARDFFAGTLVAADGSARTLDPAEFNLAPHAYRDSRYGRVPVEWRLQVPGAGLDLAVRSWDGDYWNPGSFRYWEGPVTVGGSHKGEGYLEMTGYGY